MVFVTFDVETLSTIDSTNNIRNFRIVDLIWFINGQGRTVPTAKFIDFNYKWICNLYGEEWYVTEFKKWQ